MRKLSNFTPASSPASSKFAPASPWRPRRIYRSPIRRASPCLSLRSRRNIRTTKAVVYRAGSAGLAGLDLLMAMGLARSNIILCDAKGVVYQGRTESVSPWESPYAAETHARTLAEALFSLAARSRVR